MPISQHTSSFAQQWLQGHTWTPVAGVKPCLLCALKAQEPPDIRIRRVYRGQWALDYPYTAGLYLRVRTSSAKWIAKPAYVAHLYPPGTPYWERRDARNYPQNHKEVYVTFQGGDTLRGLIDARAGYARFLDPAGQLEKLLAEAARVGALLGDHGFWKGQAILCGILDRLTTAKRVDTITWRITGPDDANTRSDFDRTVEKYLREHFAERLNLADIARHVRVSASTLTHRYRMETGLTPMEKLRDLRLTVAKGLLTKGWKLKEIAAQTGFVDAFHFSRTFKQVSGLSPREFLRTLRNRPV